MTKGTKSEMGVFLNEGLKKCPAGDTWKLKVDIGCRAQGGLKYVITDISLQCSCSTGAGLTRSMQFELCHLGFP